MTDVDTDAAVETTRPARGGGMRVPRSRGVVSGVLLVLAGAWAALAPFVGPTFNFAYTPRPNDSWHWTAARGWYEVLPGGLAVFGGLLLILSANRIVTSLGAWVAALAGGWLVVGQQVRYLLKLGSPGAPSASGDRRYVAEYLAFFTGVGALIILVAAIALGRLSVRSVRDVRAAERRDEQAALAEQEAAEREARGREEYQRSDADRYGTNRSAEAWGTGNQNAGYGTPSATAPLPDTGAATSAVTTELPAAGHVEQRSPAAGPDDDTAAMPVVPAEVVPAEVDHAEVDHAEVDHAEAEHAAEPAVSHSPEPEPEPEPPASHDAEPQPDLSATEADRPNDSASVWNPEAQSPTTTGELPTVSPSSPSNAPESPRRGVQSPRRYFGSDTAAQDPEHEATEAPARDVMRTDEGDDLNDLDLDERSDLDERTR